MSLGNLIEISRKYGSNPEFVLAGGGNTSYKDDNFLYVKCSGTTLGMLDESGIAKLSREKLSVLWSKDYPDNDKEREDAVLVDLMKSREYGEENKRPSVETSLHNLFPQKYVLHTHPAIINALTCSALGKEACLDIFGDSAVWVELEKPGFVLAVNVNKKLEMYKKQFGKDANIVILQNHGIFVAADSIDEIDSIMTDFVDKIKAKIKEVPDFSEVDFDRSSAVKIAPQIRMVLMQDTSIVTFRTNKEVLKYVENAEAFKAVSSAFTPDHMVYCKDEPLFIKKDDCVVSKINDYKNKKGFAPKIVAVEQLGYFAWGTTKKNADIAADLFKDTIKVATLAKSFGGGKFMPQEMISFINNWEVESYRQKVGLSGANCKRLNEKISIVTGSAQGFGQGAAEEMINEGANVVIADLNFELATENVLKYNNEQQANKTLAVKVDVSNEESVKSMVEDCVLEFGGLDIFVNNAGIAKAGSLEEMTLSTFDLVTKINYNAYFLCVKYASEIMKIQNKINSDYYTDIIQINSKSGLTGSNKNFAYAGSKFGGIGLTQSFALELVPFNIKVNSICPGNFFDGPLWSDPVKGLFVQYLNAEKVPGAKNVEDVKKFYESKVPMARGCSTIDVARAICYCVEQKYETGQAIPVTGGQTMLK